MSKPPECPVHDADWVGSGPCWPETGKRLTLAEIDQLVDEPHGVLPTGKEPVDGVAFACGCVYPVEVEKELIEAETSGQYDPFRTSDGPVSDDSNE